MMGWIHAGKSAPITPGERARVAACEAEIRARNDAAWAVEKARLAEADARRSPAEREVYQLERVLYFRELTPEEKVTLAAARREVAAQS